MLDRVSNLIDLVLDVFCFFFLISISSLRDFLSFWALVLVRFLLLHRDGVFMSLRKLNC